MDTTWSTKCCWEIKQGHWILHYGYYQGLERDKWTRLSEEESSGKSWGEEIERSNELGCQGIILWGNCWYALSAERMRMNTQGDTLCHEVPRSWAGPSTKRERGADVNGRMSMSWVVRKHSHGSCRWIFKPSGRKLKDRITTSWFQLSW